jgi:hypothetical protein
VPLQYETQLELQDTVDSCEVEAALAQSDLQINFYLEKLRILMFAGALF